MHIWYPDALHGTGIHSIAMKLNELLLGYSSSSFQGQLLLALAHIMMDPPWGYLLVVNFEMKLLFQL